MTPTYSVIISDIHANKLALDAVLKDADSLGMAYRLICLGDLIGYYADARECTSIIEAREPAIWLRGNHEIILFAEERRKAEIVRQLDPEAVTSNDHNHAQLSPDQRSKLRGLPHKPTPYNGVILVHSDMEDPPWGKIENPWNARDVQLPQLKRLNLPVCIYGHIHRTQIIRLHANNPDLDVLISSSELQQGWQDGHTRFAYDEWITLNTDHYWFVCVGSVGQPRDNDQRAAYAILRVDDIGNLSIQLRRVQYEVDSVYIALQQANWEQVAPNALRRLRHPW